MKRSAALVTGAGTRLGRQFALHLATLGYDITLHWKTSIESAKLVAAQIEAVRVECSIFPKDYMVGFASGEYIDAVYQRFPPFSCLTNSASVYDATPIQSTSKAILST